MSKEQYLHSGLVHTANDIEIEQSQVKRVQNTVNDHVGWLNSILECGKNWKHSDRMSRNLIDRGEQTCSMTLLAKDHKGWVVDSNKPVPSRPVVSGNSGLNCHLSELIAQIIDPITYESEGRDVDSTDHMLSKILSLNSNLKEMNASSEENISNLSVSVDFDANSRINLSKSF